MEQALENFLASEDFPLGVSQSTFAGFRGSGFSVELLPDGSWEVLWDDHILHESAGRIQRIPQLSDNDYDAFVDIARGLGIVDDVHGISLVLKGSDALEAIAQQMRDVE